MDIDTYNSERQLAAIVFIDGSLPDLQAMLAGLDPSLTVVILDSAQDGVQQIADAVQGFTDLTAIHIISHGDNGLISLGSAHLSQDTLAQYQNQLAAIGRALSADGDLLLYGCNVALGDVGQNFITALAGITGADVAASTDLTGSVLLGGDWQLEATTGAIEAVTLSANIAGVLVNFAPELDSLITLERVASIDEGTSTPNTAWSYFNGGYDPLDTSFTTFLPDGATDSETPSSELGIAIVGVSGVTGGTVEYSTDNGISWDTVDNGLLSETNAMLFRGTDLLRYTPPADVSGVRTITFHTWDGTGEYGFGYPYESGDIVDLTLTGTDGNTPFSLNTANHTLTINSVNDAPVFVVANGKLTADFGGEDFSSDIIEQDDGKILVQGTHFNGTDDDIAMVRYNADGTLDTDFGTGGKLTADFGGDEWVDEPMLQSDRSILVGFGNRMARFNTDGTLDTGFGSSGELTFVYGYSGRAILQPDDYILVAGSTNGPFSDFALERYDTSGVLDASFGTGGVVTTDFNDGYDFANEVILQADGKILVAGSSFNGVDFDIALVRYDTYGNLDTDFGSGGKLTTDFVSNDYIGDAWLQSDGKILVMGIIANTSNDNYDVIITRYTTNGSLDTSFSGDGHLTTAVASDEEDDEEIDYVMQEDDKILLTNTSFNGSNYDITLTRYTTSGSLDTSFSGDGKVTLDFGGNEYSNGAAVLKDGKILVLGGSLNGSDASFVVARYNTDGSLDNSFSGDGKFISNFGVNDFNDNDLNANLQKDGSLLVTASSSNGIDSDFAAVRINTDGSVDTSLGVANPPSGPPTYELGNDHGVVLNENVTIHDAELSTLNNFDGASLTLVRSGGTPNPQDVFSAAQGGTLDPLNEGGNLTVDGFTIGTVTTNSGGTLTLSFEFGVAQVTQTLVDSALQQIAYSNTTTVPVVPVKIDWIFNDGNTANAQGSGTDLSAFGTTTVTIKIIGTPNDDTLIGTKGDDIIDGLSGKDVLKGGKGNDSYLLDLDNVNGVAKLQDSVIELVAQGTDTLSLRADDLGLLNASTLRLGANLENIDITDTFGNLLNVTGNGANNHITGNDVDNIIKGGLGADSMAGGTGGDTYFVDNKGDLVFEVDDTPLGGLALFALSIGSGIDKVIASVNYALANFVEDLALSGLAFKATGNDLANTLTGNAAANLLIGGLGADTMIGGLGNDIYVVDDAGDSIIELPGQGTDLVKSSVDYTLDDHVEKLTLIGTAISGTGNATKNMLTGNISNNILDGGAGVDTLRGGLGNDTYMVDLTDTGALQDRVTEDIGAGTDTIQLSGPSAKLTEFTLKLGANLENMDASATGTNILNLTGNTLGNQLIGNDVNNILNGGVGADSLNGGDGNDSLIGGAGADRFDFSVALDAVTNVDKIMDFTQGDDLIMLSSSVFTALAGGVFDINNDIRAGAGVTAAETADQNLIYNSTTGNLYYDEDGLGGVAAKLFATIDLLGLPTSHPGTLTEADFGIL